MTAWWVPGRLEFLGKHTDYAGGPSLLCAVERGLAVVAAPRGDARVSVHDAIAGDRIETILSPDLAVRHGHWSNYPMTVCRRVARNFPGVARGVDIAFASDLPPAAGLSSSSALIVATFLALADANELALRPEYANVIRHNEDLAGYLGAVENGSSFARLGGDRGVGTHGGSEDHTAMLCSRPGSLVQYSFAPISFERVVTLPNDYRFVIASSGVVAEKAGAARERYNRAASRAAEALQVWRETTGSTAPTLAAAIAESGTPRALARVLAAEPELQERVTQFDVESTIVRSAADALLRGDLEKLGDLVDLSQSTATKLLGNQVPETVELAAGARALGAVAASAFGAGFGGSVYALIRSAEADEFRRRWADRYARAFPDRGDAARFFVSAAGPPAVKL